jgi:hypothetical protein
VEISDHPNIISEQKSFCEKLYISKNPIITQENEKLFFPGINKFE